MSDYEQLLAERNQLAAELGRCHSALGVLANVYDEFLLAKGKEWCDDNEAVPISQLFRLAPVQFVMPTLEHCKNAKSAAENDQS